MKNLRETYAKECNLTVSSITDNFEPAYISDEMSIFGNEHPAYKYSHTGVNPTVVVPRIFRSPRCKDP